MLTHNNLSFVSGEKAHLKNRNIKHFRIKLFQPKTFPEKKYKTQIAFG